jgi:hypothetical protein
VSDTLPVAINRDRLHSVEAPESFVTPDSFAIELENHGEAVHVHVHLDDALSEIASVEAINHHLRPGAVRRVPITVHETDRPVTGRLKLAAAYGAETRFIEVSTGTERNAKPPVEVDAALGRSRRSGTTSPTRPANRGSSSGGLLAGLDAPALALGGAVVFIALVVLVAIDNAVFLIAVLLVLAGIVAAGYTALQ